MKTLWMAAALSILSFPVRGAPAAQPSKPKLVVVIVLDQYRYDYTTRFAELYDPDGAFARLRRNGAFFTGAQYGHATTYTGPGHAHLLTGGYASQTGIVGNKWLDRASGKVVAAAGDPDSHWIVEGDEGEGTSPKNLVGTTVGDELVLNSRGRSKVVAIALKSRSAILLGGKLGTAYWFNESAGEFTSSTHYMKTHPAWVTAWNERKVADRWFGKEWKAALPEGAGGSGLDDAPWEGDLKGAGRVFPHAITGKLDRPGADFYDALGKSPFANDVQLDFVKAAIEAEGLGADGDPDLLAFSLSATDEVGHTFGPYSREVAEMAVATDRQLGAFLRWLDKKVPGATVVLTADHGAAPIPEYMQSLGVEAFRVKKKSLKDAVEVALDAKYGEGEWVLALEDPSLYLDEKVIAARKLVREEVESTAAAALESVRGVQSVYTRSALLRGEPASTAIGRAYQVCFYAPRSGDLFIAMKPYSFWGKYAEYDYGDSHGSPYAYDTHVPLVIAGPGILPGVVREPTSMADVAPTIAALLGVTPPPSAEGQPVARILRK